MKLRFCLLIICGLVSVGIGTSRAEQEAETHPDWVHRAFAGSPPRDQMVSENGMLRWVSLLGDRRLRHAGEVTGMAFSPDGTWIASSASDETVRIWETATGGPCWPLPRQSDQVWDVAVSPDGLWIASGADGIKVWDVATGREWGFSAPGPVFCCREAASFNSAGGLRCPSHTRSLPCRPLAAGGCP